MVILLLWSWISTPSQAPDTWFVRAYLPPGAASVDLPAIQGASLLRFDPRGFWILEVTDAGETALRNMGLEVQRDWGLSTPNPQSMANGTGIPGFPCYPTLSETYAWIDDQVATYPELANKVDIGDSWEKQQGLGGSDLLTLVLTNEQEPGPKPALFLMGAIHARELSPGGVTFRFAQELLEGYGTDPDITWILDHTEIHIFIIANPDGRLHAEQGFFWRKNTNNTVCANTSSRGVDLNRNFAFQWGLNSGCSSDIECDNTYRGVSPASEPEVDAVQDYVRSLFPDQRGPNLNDPAPPDTQGLFFDLHSFGRVTLWPYGFDQTLAPNDSELTTLGRKLSHFNGYSPEKASINFDTCGTTDDFAYGDLGIGAYTFELGNQFFEPCDSFENEIWPTNRDALLYAAKVARAPYLWPSGPDTLAVQTSANALTRGMNLTVRATVNDDRFQVATSPPGEEPVQTIQAAEWTEVPPWLAEATPQAMIPSDGSFSSSSEAVQATIATQSLLAGSHRLYLRGQDASGFWGAPSAAEFSIYEPNQVLSLTGTVLALDTGLPMAAQFQAGTTEGTSDPQSGAIAAAIPPGTHTLTVTADGYLPYTQTLTASAGSTRNLPIVLVPQCPAVPRTDFAASKWTGEGSWTYLEDEQGKPIWDDSPDGPYPDQRDDSLTSPVFWPEPGQTLELSFRHQYAMDPYGADVLAVEFRSGGGAWEPLALYRGSHPQEDVLFTLPTEAKGPCQLRFRRQSDQAFNDSGWTLDHLVLRQRGTACVLGQLWQAWPQIDIRSILPYL